MKYFGTDGIRGYAGTTLSADLAYRVGKAIFKLNCHSAVIGFDTRESNQMLAYSVASGAMSMGINIINIGVVPTPCLIYYSSIMNVVGIMITASHNPYYDNGIKILYNGLKLSVEQESKVELGINEELKSDKIGKLTYNLDFKKKYQDFLIENSVLTSKKIVIDCANGGTYKTAPNVFKKICNNLVICAHHPNGKNINLEVGSTHLEYLKSLVLKHNADIGFAFDGDGDRVLAVDEFGNSVDGDKLIYIIASYLHEKGKLNDNTVVLTKMSNLGLVNQLKSKGINVILTDVGDKNVLNELLKNNYSIGGENSGHIIMPEILGTGDGTLNALQIIKIIEDTNLTLFELSKDIEMYPNKLINVIVKNKEKVQNIKEVKDRLREIEKILGAKGKVLLRPSGTENLFRVSVMAQSEKLVNEFSNELVDLIKSYDGGLK